MTVGTGTAVGVDFILPPTSATATLYDETNLNNLIKWVAEVDLAFISVFVSPALVFLLALYLRSHP